MLLEQRPATGNTSAWQYQTSAFTAAGYRVIAYDRRCAGVARSSMPMVRRELPPMICGDCSIRWTSIACILSATAGGGFVAFDFALSFPERLRILVVADSIGGVQHKEILDLDTGFARRSSTSCHRRFAKPARATGRRIRRGRRGVWLSKKQSRPSRPAASTLQLAYSMLMRNRLTLSLFEQIRTPALLLTGGADMTAPPALMKIQASHIPNAEFLVVPNAGHSVYWEEPELFNGTVLAFIRKY